MGFQGNNQAAVLKMKLISQKHDLQELLLMKQMNAYLLFHSIILTVMSAGSGTARVERGAA